MLAYVDTHNHQTFWSPDAVNRPDELLGEAVSLGLLGLMLTDHYDYTGEPNDWCFDPDAYVPAMEALRRDDAVPRVLYGIEIDYQAQHHEQIARVASAYDFDHIIVSKHYFFGIDPYSRPDLVASTFGDLKTYCDAVVREIAASAEALKTANTVGHYCYASRYAPWQQSKFNYETAPQAFDLLFRTAIANNQAIEINLQTIDKLIGKGYANEDALPDRAIFARYYELGGRLITLASDSHRPGQLGRHAGVVMAMLAEIGFTELTYFVRRRPFFTPLPRR